MNLFGMYRLFGVVPQGLDVSFLFPLFGDFQSLFLDFSFIARFVDLRVFLFGISLRGSWVSSLCLFVDDLDPSNTGFGLRFVDFWMNPRS
jgi:hypothetical protein